MILFIDSSALVKLYVEEPGSERMRDAAQEAPVAVSTLTFAEVHATFARRKREKLLSAPEFTQLRRRLAADWEELTQVPVGAEILTLIPGLCKRHPLRGADALQLASALLLRQNGLEITFACSDRLLRESATAEGLPTFDPVQVEAETARRFVPPPLDLETRAEFDQLAGRVTATLAQLNTDPETRQYLDVLWHQVQSWARDEEEPSFRKLAGLLGVPRERLPGLYSELKQVVARCLEADQTVDT